LVDFNIPQSGFFLWIKVQGIKDTWKMLMQRGVTEGVIMAPGAAFMRDTSKPCNAIRASFTKASYKEMDLVFSLFIYIFYLYIFYKITYQKLNVYVHVLL